MRNLKTSHFERKETKFVGNKTAIYGRSLSSLFLVSVKLAHLCVFLRVADLSHRQEQGGSMPSTQAVIPSPGHSAETVVRRPVQTFDKRSHRHKPFDRQRFVSVWCLRHAQMPDLVEV